MEDESRDSNQETRRAAFCQRRGVCVCVCVCVCVKESNQIQKRASGWRGPRWGWVGRTQPWVSDPRGWDLGWWGGREEAPDVLPAAGSLMDSQPVLPESENTCHTCSYLPRKVAQTGSFPWQLLLLMPCFEWNQFITLTVTGFTRHWCQAKGTLPVSWTW